MNNLTKGRVYGTVCAKHPEMMGLRNVPYIRRRRKADDAMTETVREGNCVGCRQEYNSRKRKPEVGVPDGIMLLAQALGVAKIPSGRLSIKHRMRV